jgi:hypothetical protein
MITFRDGMMGTGRIDPFWDLSIMFGFPWHGVDKWITLDKHKP